MEFDYFANALILTRFGLGWLCVHFHKCLKELWPLTNVRISFPLNILGMNGWNLTKFVLILM